MSKVDNKLLKQIKSLSYTEGSFTTRAGKKTSYYIDKYLFTSVPSVLAPLSKVILSNLPHPSHYDRLMAPAMGAISLATPLAVTTQKPLLIYEKEEEQTNIYGPYYPGERILVIEDVLTTGSTVLDLCEYVKKIPLDVIHIISVIDRQEGAHETLHQRGYSSSSLITAQDLHDC